MTSAHRIASAQARPQTGPQAYLSRFSLTAFMMSQADGFYFDSTIAASTWQDTSATTPADEIGEAIGRIDDRRSGAGSPHNATQSSGTLKPLRQSAGAKFDGSDDYLATDYLASSGANFIAAYVVIPASLASNAYIIGTGAAAAANRFALVINTSGRAGGAVGAHAIGTIFGGSDLRNTTVAVALSIDGSNVKVYADTTKVYDAAQSGTITTAVPLWVGALNNNNASAGFFGGTIIRAAVGREHLTPARWLQLRGALISG